MAKTDITFSIENSETSQKLKTQGIYKNRILKFFDDDHVKHTVFIGENSIRYKKNGPILMDFVFEENLVHTGKYQMKHGMFQFEIHTHELTIKESHIEVIYTLKQNGEFVNKGHLNVEYETI